jgi:hypothetical protein
LECFIKELRKRPLDFRFSDSGLDRSSSVFYVKTLRYGTKKMDLNMNKPDETPSGGLRRSASSNEASRRKQSPHRSSVSSQQNAAWDSRGSQVLSSAATQVLFQDNRRGSNGVIPGQQLQSFPPPSLRPHADPPPAEDEFNSCLSRIHKGVGAAKRNRSRIYDDPAVVAGYNSVPLLDLDQLPRGGISIETKSVGRIQVSHNLYNHGSFGL